MPRRKVVLITMPYDQGDILEDFLEWHFHQGVDLIIAVDGGSTDGSRAILERYSKTRPVVWYPLPERNLTKYLPADAMAKLARDEYDAAWIIHCDADEFLCTRHGDLHTILDEAERNGITLLTIPRHNMTGEPLRNGDRATQALTLRIDRKIAAGPEEQLSWAFPVPFVFLDAGGGHLAIRASAFEQYGAGAHVATTTWGAHDSSDQFYILHYPMRGFDAFHTKVQNTRTWLEDNPHWTAHWAWHWRRWIKLDDEGRLREDYDAQFVLPESSRELVANGTCVVDTSVADWIASTRRPWR